MSRKAICHFSSDQRCRKTAPVWCKVVQMTDLTSKPKREPKTARASVSFPADLYATLELIAEQRKVSVAWIIRDAAEKYVGEQWPLLERKGQGA
jgi:hypothetical protein